MHMSLIRQPASIARLFLLAAMLANVVVADLLYHFDFEEKGARSALRNLGTVGGSAAITDMEEAPAPRFVSDAPAGSETALRFQPHRHNRGTALTLPDSTHRFRLGKPGQAMTIAAWVNWMSDGTRSGIAGKSGGHSSAGGGDGWTWFIKRDGRLRFEYQNERGRQPSNVAGRETINAIPAGKWVHVAVVIDTTPPSGSTGIQFFVNGRPVPLNNPIGAPDILSSNEPVRLAATFPTGAPALQGALDDVRLYDSAIPQRVLAQQVQGLSLPSSPRVENYIRELSKNHRELDIQRLVNDAVANGRRTVIIPEGRFHVSEGVRLNGVDGFTLRGAGPEKTVLVNGLDGVAVGVSDSKNVTLRNFALDRDPVPFVQATLTAVSPSGTMAFQVHEGYPQLTDEVWKHIHGTVQFFDRETRRLVERHHHFGPRLGDNVIRIDESHGRLELSPVWAERVREGDFVVFKSGSSGAGLLFRNSESVRVENVTILASPSIGIGARFLTGENYFSYTIKRGPTPNGATQPRLFGSNADGMQYFWSPGSVTFENCDLGFTGDDCINISLPQALQVVEVQGDTRFLATTRMHPSFARQMVELSEAGDVIRLERYGTFRPFGDVPLKRLEYRGHEQGAAWVAGEGRHSQGMRSMAHMLVELAAKPSEPVQTGDRVVPRKFLPERFVIRNSRFHDTFARGLLVMASNGVIENNRIDYTGMCGLQLCHEIPGFGGADWVSNVVVRDNTIRHTCFDDDITRYYGAHKVAALQLSNTPIYRREPIGSYPWATAHSNVRILNNTIEDSGAGGILINGLQKGWVRGNVVKNTNQRGGRCIGKPMGLTVPYAITIMNSSNVDVSNNRVINYGKAEEPVGNLGTYPITPGE